MRKSGMSDAERGWAAPMHRDRATWEDLWSLLDPARSGKVFLVDVEELPDSYKVMADVPGAAKEEIDLEMHNGNLTICVKDREQESGSTYLQQERQRRSACRTVHLPADSDPGRVSALLRDGILTVTIEKIPAAKAKLIEVRSPGGSATPTR